MNSSLDHLQVSLQYLLPQHLLSRLAGKITDSRRVWLKDFLIKWGISYFKIDLSDALEANPANYNCFNDFFTRALLPQARPIDNDPHTVSSPADGTLSQAGLILNKCIIQAKGRDFRVSTLLGITADTNDTDIRVDSPHQHNLFENGFFSTIYLSPKDYHRVHMPLTGVLRETHYIPGKLFSVNHRTTRHIQDLYAKNERLVCWFDTEFGTMAVILVGAMLVAGIETVWHGQYSPRTDTSTLFGTDGPQLAKGQELGRFKFGSTIIVLLPKEAKLEKSCHAGDFIKMGSPLAKLDEC